MSNEYVMPHRSHTFRSKLGHAVRFEKGVPVHVPPALVRDVVAIGAIKVEGDTPDPLAPEAPQPTVPTDEERAHELRQALMLIREGNNPNDFTAAGVPTVKAVAGLSGLRDITAVEIKDAWVELTVGNED